MKGFDSDSKAGVITADQINPEASGMRLMQLRLTVREPEVVQELAKFPEGPAREDFALTALRLGVLALRQASGFIDTQTIREEGNRLVLEVRELLKNNSEKFSESVSGTLAKYFDPTNGNLPQRLERLVKKDGELEVLLGKHLEGEASTLQKSLAQHVGMQSPLLKLLSPNQSDGILAGIKEAVSANLSAQREHILKQFTLDDKESALSRMVAELKGTNGQLKKDLAEDLNTIRSEFSLSNEQGALSTLVRRVEKAQKTIVDQFTVDNTDSALSKLSRLLEKTNSKVEGSLTLDDEKSPLSRLRRELLNVIQDLGKANNEFQTDVRTTLATFKARREEAARSTTHGNTFENEVGQVLQREAQRLGDVFETTGEKTGIISRCKKGDFVISMSAECVAANARIVCEAKEDKSYDLTMALAEMAEAKKNRGAQVGIFVFSKATAPAGLEPIVRHDKDIVVVWDQEDPMSDLLLKAALSIARALVVREKVARERSAADFTVIDDALLKMAKDAKDLEEVATWTNTIKNNSEKILGSIAKVRKNLEERIEMVREHIENLKQQEAGTGVTNG